MNNLVIISFVLVSLSYLYILYKKKIYVATFYWLGSFMISFIVPNLLKDNVTYGYAVSSTDFTHLNIVYLFVLLLFIICNFAVLVLFPLKLKKGSYKNLSYGTVSRANSVYLVLSIAAVFLRRYDIILTLVVFGLMLTAIVRLLYSTNKKQILNSMFRLLYALVYSLWLSFARRDIILPLVIGALFYMVTRNKKPRFIFIIIGVVISVMVIMPLMVSIRTFGFGAGVMNYKTIVFGGSQEVLMNYLQMSTDVSWSYSLSAIIIKYGFHMTPSILLKPLMVLFPRWFLDAKPLPLSLLLVRELHLSANPNTSIPAGIIGEAYLYFGIIGLVLVGAMWGVLTGYVDRNMDPQRDGEYVRNDFNILIFMTLLIQIITGAIRGDIATTLTETESVVIPFIIVLNLSRMRNTSR